MAYILLPIPRVEVSAKKIHWEESFWPQNAGTHPEMLDMTESEPGTEMKFPIPTVTHRVSATRLYPPSKNKRKANKSKCPGSTRTADLDRSCCPREKFLFPAFSKPVKKNIWPTPPKVRQPSEVLCPIKQCSVFLLPLTSTTNWRKLQNGRELPKLQMGGKKIWKT